MSFEEWWNDQDNGAPAMVFETEESMAKAAYNAGLAAERERCARIAETQFCCDDGEEELIAAAIRRGDGQQ